MDFVHSFIYLFDITLCRPLLQNYRFERRFLQNDLNPLGSFKASKSIGLKINPDPLITNLHGFLLPLIFFNNENVESQPIFWQKLQKVLNSLTSLKILMFVVEIVVTVPLPFNRC